MGNDFYRKLGATFLVIAAIIYAFERVGWRIAFAIEANSGNGVASPVHTGFFDNLFVPVFSLVGIILFVYGFPGKKE
ncbi:hypothetical protein [Cohnella abietis]|uniref:Uncharacterized protein n=1 Tax=Cohnella abietis TaxID=2507935 RepID=A0A3T1DBF6_9BACL|nr:hypothetical protein [Cohnella abietis]BBI35437.1 hypothetical protein KCTCHS21_48360 [Cohnella abietis]